MRIVRIYSYHRESVVKLGFFFLQATGFISHSVRFCCTAASFVTIEVATLAVEEFNKLLRAAESMVVVPGYEHWT